MKESFDMWNRNIKKPNDLKEAALYALESRMLNEEHSRISEQVIMKDVIIKLIYSVQQHLTGTSKYLKAKSFKDYEENNVKNKGSQSPRKTPRLGSRSNSGDRERNGLSEHSIIGENKKIIDRRGSIDNPITHNIRSKQFRLGSSPQLGEEEEKFSKMRRADSMLLKRLLFLKHKISVP
jgi:hypothetical protein